MKIGFTGHRNAPAGPERLAQIHQAYPEAEWVTGGAIGFDNSVEAYAAKNGIKNTIYKPDYKTHGRAATFIRNRLIVDSADLIVCMYNGGNKGGTAYTVSYALKQKKPVKNIYEI